MSEPPVLGHPAVARIGDRARQLGLFLHRRPRLLVWLGLALTLWVALSESQKFVPVSREWVELKLATPNEDIHNIYIAASHARWRDVPTWFAGPWVYRQIGYYRPLTSLLYFFEYRAFDRDFTAYNRVTWVLHGVNSVLLFLLAVSLFRERRLVRVAYGLIAVLFFATDYNSMLIAVSFSLGWWPSQNDILSLTFGLMSLLLLDQYLVKGRRGCLVAAMVAFACAIGSKEMGYAVLPVALALIWHRKRRLHWEMGAFTALGIFFWFLRKLVVPNPWGENYFTAWVARKAAFYWGGPVYLLMLSGIWWRLGAAACILIIGAIGLKKRWPVMVTVAAMVVASALCAQFLQEEGTWAAALMEGDMYSVGRVVIYLLAMILFWRYRRVEPGLFAMSALALVFVPILQFVGYHYLYWPSAFLALADACFCACLLRFVREVRPTLNWAVPGLRRLVPAEATSE